MEHLADPVQEVELLAQCARPGTLLVMSTFFNSCNGADPSHLQENDIYQDTALWFSIVRNKGWLPYKSDPRGCLKVFIRETD
jgi:hypothetical protein